MRSENDAPLTTKKQHKKPSRTQRFIEGSTSADDDYDLKFRLATSIGEAITTSADENDWVARKGRHCIHKAFTEIVKVSCTEGLTRV